MTLHTDNSAGAGAPSARAPARSPRLSPAVRDHATTFSRFALVGAAKTVIDFAVFNLVLLLTTSSASAPAVLAANTLSFAVAAAVSFRANARFAFRRRARKYGLALYLGVSLAGLAVYDLAVAAQLLLFLPHGVVALNAIKMTSLGASLAVNYVGYRRLVFVHRHPGTRGA